MVARTKVIALGGGLELDRSPLQMNPGGLVSCLNYEMAISNGHTRIQGYERYDGQPAPSDGYDPDPLEDTTEARRAAITKVPGEGPIRGVHLYQGLLYAFRDNVGQTECKMYKATPAGWTEIVTGTTLNAGGRYEIITYNFEGASSSAIMLGVSGTNKAFTYDGVTYTEIDIEGDTNFPIHIVAMNNYLFLGMESGNLYWSVVGDPTDFTSLNGAGYLGVGGPIKGLHEATGGTLIIRMEGRISVLTGNSPTSWAARSLRTNDESIGGEAYSAVQYGNWYYLDERGVMELGATESYGDFASNLVSMSVTRWLSGRTKAVRGVLVSKEKRQIRWLFNNPAGSDTTEVLTMRFGREGPEGFTTQKYLHGVNCTCFGVLGVATEENAMFFGTNDGFVMRLDKGSSFDGEDIESFIQLPYWHLDTPQMRKHFKRIIFTTEANGSAVLQMRPFFNYSDPDAARHIARDVEISGSGSLWDQSFWNQANWNSFFWASMPVLDGRFDVTGTGKNLSVFIYNKSTCAPFTIYEALIQYTLRGMYR